MIHRTNGRNHGIAKPIIKSRRWTYLLIWIVPGLAAVAASFYYYQYSLKQGPEIIINFKDADGLKESQTRVQHIGVEIGEVSQVELSPDHASVRVHVRLQRKQEAFAREGTVFWIVRPEISFGGITGLNTVLSGPYIEATPGDGPPTSEFNGLQRQPSAQGPGLHIVLHAPRLEHVQPESAVYYRGIQVGTVQSIGLNSDADGVDFHLFIQQRYQGLVRSNSEFWIVNGIDVKAGLLTGVQMKLDSLRTLIAGGVAFNSPDDKIGPVATDGAEFPLYEEPKKDWPTWAPKIPLPPEDSDSSTSATPSNQETLSKAMKGK
jgi:paraquat-inducible protein B